MPVISDSKTRTFFLHSPKTTYSLRGVLRQGHDDRNRPDRYKTQLKATLRYNVYEKHNAIVDAVGVKTV